MSRAYRPVCEGSELVVVGTAASSGRIAAQHVCEYCGHVVRVIAGKTMEHWWSQASRQHYRKHDPQANAH